MRVKIAAIGKQKSSSDFKAAYDSYIKRIPWNVELLELEEKKSLPENQLKDKEASILLEATNSCDVIIALDENGKNISSEDFAGKISDWQDEGKSSFAFLIGGAAGHGQEVKQKADLLLSLGKMTWPHMMVRQMLAEQLYRAHTIITGHPYHRS